MHRPKLKRAGVQDVQDVQDAQSRQERFGSQQPGSVYLQLKQAREIERRKAIRDGLIPDPQKALRLEDAIDFVGTCMEMCPRFEREERAYQQSVDPWERFPGTKDLDPARAVKSYHRPAAGNDQPLPSDVRPPEVLQATLDYLFHELLPQQPLSETHGFLRDRTRSVRQDFTLQHERGPVAVICHERIARYHIMCLHELSSDPGFSEQQETEQLKKVLQSLMEFYDDGRDLHHFPNEAEFRAYHTLAHLRDPDSLWSIEHLPSQVYHSAILQLALELRRMVQRNNDSTRRGRLYNHEATQNAFTRFFKILSLPAVPYILACLVGNHFGEIRQAALKSLRKCFMAGHRAFPIESLTLMLGCDNDLDTAKIASAFGIEIQMAEFPHADRPVAVVLHRKSGFNDTVNFLPRSSNRMIEPKRAGISTRDLIDGIIPFLNLPSQLIVPKISHRTQALSQPSANPTSSFFFNQAVSHQNSSFPPPVNPPKPYPFSKAEKENPGRRALRGAYAHMPVPRVPSFVATAPFGERHTSLSAASSTEALSSALTPFPYAAERQGRVRKSSGSAFSRIVSPIPHTFETHGSQSSTVILPSSLSNEAGHLDIISKPSVETTIITPDVMAASSRPITPPQVHEERARAAKQKSATLAALTESVYDLMIRSIILGDQACLVASEFESKQLKRSFLNKWRNSTRDKLLAEQSIKYRKLEIKRILEGERFAGQAAIADKILLYEEPAIPLITRYGQNQQQTFIQESKKVQCFWAKGTFLNVVRHHIFERLSPQAELPVDWTVWVCTDPGGGSTGRWLRAKFGADKEVSDLNIYSTAVGPLAREVIPSPGLLIIEYGPGDWNVWKSRVLQVLTLLPDNRLYIPSLIFVLATSEEVTEIPPSFMAWMDTWIGITVLSVRQLILSHLPSPEDQLDSILAQTPLDLRGEANPPIPFETLTRAFLDVWFNSLGAGLSISSYSATYDWPAVGRLTTVLLAALSEAVQAICKECHAQPPWPPWPPFDSSSVLSAETASSTLIQYLLQRGLAPPSAVPCGDPDFILLLRHLANYIQLHLESLHLQPRRHLSRSSVDSRIKDFEAGLGKQLREIPRHIPTSVVKRKPDEGPSLPVKRRKETSLTSDRRLQPTLADLSELKISALKSIAESEALTKRDLEPPWTWSKDNRGRRSEFDWFSIM